MLLIENAGIFLATYYELHPLRKLHDAYLFCSVWNTVRFRRIILQSFELFFGAKLQHRFANSYRLINPGELSRSVASSFFHPHTHSLSLSLPPKASSEEITRTRVSEFDWNKQKIDLDQSGLTMLNFVQFFSFKSPSPDWWNCQCGRPGKHDNLL